MASKKDKCNNSENDSEIIRDSLGLRFERARDKRIHNGTDEFHVFKFSLLATDIRVDCENAALGLSFEAEYNNKYMVGADTMEEFKELFDSFLTGGMYIVFFDIFMEDETFRICYGGKDGPFLFVDCRPMGEGVFQAIVESLEKNDIDGDVYEE